MSRMGPGTCVTPSERERTRLVSIRVQRQRHREHRVSLIHHNDPRVLLSSGTMVRAWRNSLLMGRLPQENPVHHLAGREPHKEASPSSTQHRLGTCRLPDTMWTAHRRMRCCSEGWSHELMAQECGVNRMAFASPRDSEKWSCPLADTCGCVIPFSPSRQTWQSHKNTWPGWSVEVELQIQEDNHR